MIDEPLGRRFDTALFDLDGVLYAGDRAVPGAAEHVTWFRDAGAKLGYVTNNAARTPAEVAEKLTKMEVPATAGQVVTSAQAAAGMLVRELPPRARVLVVGEGGLVEAVTERGLVPVFAADDGPSAVVQGFHPDLGWRALAEGAYAVARGLPWVASNTDLTLPTEAGFAPGNGALVETIAIATGRRPRVAGKPERPVFTEALDRLGASAAGTLVIGDRLDTDIAGAHNAGLVSLLVLTGVSGVRDLLRSPEGQRPVYVASDLAALSLPYREPQPEGAAVRCGGWVAEEVDGRVSLSGDGREDEAVRALCALAWRHADPETLDFDAVDIARQ